MLTIESVVSELNSNKDSLYLIENLKTLIGSVHTKMPKKFLELLALDNTSGAPFTVRTVSLFTEPTSMGFLDSTIGKDSLIDLEVMSLWQIVYCINRQLYIWNIAYTLYSQLQDDKLVLNLDINRIYGNMRVIGHVAVKFCLDIAHKPPRTTLRYPFSLHPFLPLGLQMETEYNIEITYPIKDVTHIIRKKLILKDIELPASNKNIEFKFFVETGMKYNPDVSIDILLGSTSSALPDMSAITCRVDPIPVKHLNISFIKSCLTKAFIEFIDENSEDFYRATDLKGEEV